MGSVAYCNPYESADEYLKKKIWPTPMDAKGQENCHWGNLCEPEAEEAFISYMATFVGHKDIRGWTLENFEVKNLGLYVCKKPGYAMLGMSPDGILHTEWTNHLGETIKQINLIEYKCPVPRYDPDKKARLQTARKLKVQIMDDVTSFPDNEMNSYTYSNGDQYDGFWKDGMRHGKGMYTFVDGTSFDGDWDCNRLGKDQNGRKVSGAVKIRNHNTNSHTIPASLREYYQKFVLEHKTWQDKCKNSLGLYKNSILPKKLLPCIRDKWGEYPESDWKDSRRKLPLPPYYNSQIMYGMELFDMSGITMDKCHFVVYCPMKTSVTPVQRDYAYGKWLITKAKEFWMERYAKNFVLKQSNMLLEGETV